MLLKGSTSDKPVGEFATVDSAWIELAECVTLVYMT